MNGARTIFRRKGYLLTALAAAVLLAASSGTAYAQRVTIGFVGTSGEVSEQAFLSANALEEPQQITVRVQGLKAGGQRSGDIDDSLGNVTITPKADVYIARVTSSGYKTGAAGNVDADATVNFGPGGGDEAAFVINKSHFLNSDEVVLAVTHSPDGTPDGNWLEEMIELQLEVDEDATTVSDPASVSPDIYTLTVKESHVAPAAAFLERDFTLSEQSERIVNLDIVSGIRGVPLPGTRDESGALTFAGAETAFTGTLSVRVSNHHLVWFEPCPVRGVDPEYNQILFSITTGEDWQAGTATNFSNTSVLTTEVTIKSVAEGAPRTVADTAEFTIDGCGDGEGIRDPYITLTVMGTGLSGKVAGVPTYGSISTGSPLMISIDSDEAAPTLSFSPTDVTIDEGGSTSTVLLAEGPRSADVEMVKLSIEGDAMVSLMQDGEMLEEMDGYVYVDLGGNSAARLTAMSHSDPDLMDGDMAFKAWKLMEGSAEGVNIGEGYWFRVDVRGSTAVPALPLVGQLLLALFLMAGGARLYRRRQG